MGSPSGPVVCGGGMTTWVPAGSSGSSSLTVSRTTSCCSRARCWWDPPSGSHRGVGRRCGRRRVTTPVPGHGLARISGTRMRSLVPSASISQRSWWESLRPDGMRSEGDRSAVGRPGNRLRARTTQRTRLVGCHRVQHDAVAGDGEFSGIGCPVEVDRRQSAQSTDVVGLSVDHPDLVGFRVGSPGGRLHAERQPSAIRRPDRARRMESHRRGRSWSSQSARRQRSDR